MRPRIAQISGLWRIMLVSAISLAFSAANEKKVGKSKSCKADFDYGEQKAKINVLFELVVPIVATRDDLLLLLWRLLRDELCHRNLDLMLKNRRCSRMRGVGVWNSGLTLNSRGLLNGLLCIDTISLISIKRVWIIIVHV